MNKRLSSLLILAMAASTLAIGATVSVAGAEPPLPTQSSECGAGFVKDYVPCVPVAPDGDWNCGDDVIEALNSAIRIDLGDPYGFDADGDGYGCDGNGDRPALLPAAIMCEGRLATIIGSAGNDVLRGTDGDDVIVGLGGNDRIFGFDGDDILCGNEGRDRIYGGDGDDKMIGGTNNDVLRGGRGHDYLHGQQGNDRLFGSQGRDVLLGGSGRRDILQGNGSRDECIDRQTTTVRVSCEL